MTFKRKTSGYGRRDYNFDEWEEEKPDAYDYLLTSPTEELNYTLPNLETAIIPSITSTAPSSTSTIQEEITIPLTISSTSTTTTVSTTTISVTDTTTPSTTSLTTSSTPTVSMPPISESITSSAVDTVTTESTPPPTTVNSMLDEITYEKNRLHSGYFIASLMVLMKVMRSREPTHIPPMMAGLNGAVSSLNANNRLLMFSSMVADFVTGLVQVWSRQQVDVIIYHADNFANLLEKRQTELLPSANAVMDVADTIMDEDDHVNMANVLAKIEKYPAVEETSFKLANELIEALVLIPYSSVEGTAKERLLQLEINNALTSLFTESGLGPMFRRNQIKDQFHSITRGSITTKEMLSKHWSPKATRRFILGKLFKKPSTVNKSTSMEDFNYLKNTKIVKRMKKRMNVYKEKFKVIKKKEGKFKTKRGPTSTTTTTTTTTVKPPMHKSNYYVRKYVKKNLYKMKTTTIKTTVFRWRYYGKIRKFNIESEQSICANTSSECSSSASGDRSDSEGYYPGGFDDTEESDRSLNTSQSKEIAAINNARVTEKIKKYEVWKPIRTELRRENEKTTQNLKSSIRNGLKYILDNTMDSEYSNDETNLKAHIHDIMVHNHRVNSISDDKRRYIKKITHKLRKSDSISDEETILKGNIYKVFGYSDDFAKRLRTISKNKLF